MINNAWQGTPCLENKIVNSIDERLSPFSNCFIADDLDDDEGDDNVNTYYDDDNADDEQDVYRLSFIVYRLLFIVCRLLFIVYCLSFIEGGGDEEEHVNDREEER